MHTYNLILGEQSCLQDSDSGYWDKPSEKLKFVPINGRNGSLPGLAEDTGEVVCGTEQR